MVDPVYTLCQIAGVDPYDNDITGIAVHNDVLIVWYIDKHGVRRHKSESYSL